MGERESMRLIWRRLLACFKRVSIIAHAIIYFEAPKDVSYGCSTYFYFFKTCERLQPW